MEPKREPGDDRIMWKVRPISNDGERLGGWAVDDDFENALEMIEDGDLGHSYEVRRDVVTAEEWNAMPEFEGW